MSTATGPGEPTVQVAGRWALVVGASRGIGAAVSERLAADGFRLILVARDREDLERTGRRLPGSGHRVLSADLTSEAGRTRLLDGIVGSAPVSVVVLGLRIRRPWTRLVATSPTDLDTQISENLGYVMALMAALVPAQRDAGFGRWIAISSAVAAQGGQGQGAYVAQKSALEGLMRTLALEEGLNGITANVVAPGFIRTEGTVAYPTEVFERLSAANALGRVGHPQEVAHVVSMLAHPDGGFVTGATIPVSGGVELGWAIGEAARGAFHRPPLSHGVAADAG